MRIIKSSSWLNISTLFWDIILQFFCCFTKGYRGERQPQSWGEDSWWVWWPGSASCSLQQNDTEPLFFTSTTGACSSCRLFYDIWFQKLFRLIPNFSTFFLVSNGTINIYLRTVVWNYYNDISLQLSLKVPNSEKWLELVASLLILSIK